MKRVIWCAGLVALSAGCYGPENEFNKFNFRCGQATQSICVEAPPPDMDAGTCEVPGDPTPEDVDLVAGLYFIAIGSGIPTAELFPSMQQVQITDPEELPDHRIQINMASRAVAACDPSSNIEDFDPPRQFIIERDGTLVLALGEQSVPLPGNPIIPAPIRSDVTLTTQVCKNRPDFVCGTTQGQLFEPVMSELMGTFAMQRVQMHGEVPEQIFIDCSMTEAAPIAEFPVCAGL